MLCDILSLSVHSEDHLHLDGVSSASDSNRDSPAHLGSNSSKLSPLVESEIKDHVQETTVKRKCSFGNPCMR